MKATDSVKIEDLEVFARHGVLTEEKSLGQKFAITLECFFDVSAAGRSDDLTKTVNYKELADFASELFRINAFDLIEAAAEHLAREILVRYSLIEMIKIKISKPWAPIGHSVKTVSVQIARSRHTAYISTGSNMGDREEHIRRGIAALNENKLCRVTKVSDFIETKPYGNENQDKFINACFELKTLLSAEELLKLIHEIEKSEGRTRKEHWGPRTLDLDILLYDDLIMRSDSLNIPHIDMENREFVLKPLTQIAPKTIHPLYNIPIVRLNDILEKRCTA